MRGSLKGVLARVDRLAVRMGPSAEGLEAEIKTMSDEDLEALIARIIEQAAGPAETFETVDAFRDAVCATMHQDRDKRSGFLDAAHHHWLRLRWRGAQMSNPGVDRHERTRAAAGVAHTYRDVREIDEFKR